MTMANWDAAEVRFVRERQHFDEANKETNERRVAQGLAPLVYGGERPDSGVETMMFYAGEDGKDIPWHVREGEDVPGAKVGVAEAKTSAEAAKIAQIDWPVEKGQLWGGPTQRLIEDRVALYRVTDGRVLGIVSPRYQVIQNSEAFEFLDSLVKDGVMHYVAAMSLFDGRQIVLTAKMEEDWRVLDDQHSTYIVLRTSHDVSGMLEVVNTDYRAICQNTTRMAMANGKNRIKVQHVGDTKSKLAKASELMQITTGQQRRYAAWLEELAAHKVGKKAVASVERAIFGSLDDEEDLSSRKKNLVAQFRAIYDAEVGRNGDNGYSLLNTVSGYSSHVISVNKMSDGNERMKSMVDGTAAYTNSIAFAALEKATGVKLVTAGAS